MNTTVDTAERVIERVTGLDFPKWAVGLALMVLMFVAIAGAVFGPYWYGKHVGAREEREKAEQLAREAHAETQGEIREDLAKLGGDIRAGALAAEQARDAARGIASRIKAPAVFDASKCPPAAKADVVDANVGRGGVR